MGTRKLDGTPVLIYHGFTDSEPHVHGREAKYSISGLLFRQHIQFLRDEGFSTTTAIPEFWAGPPVSHVRKTALLSFDDGRASDYEVAFPVLLEARMLATFFVNSANVGTPGYLTWSQINEMHRFGMSFQSHGHDHVYLSRIPKSELKKQLLTSRLMVEDRTGAAVRFIAAPYGDMNRSVLSTACDLGYSAVCTSYNWPAQPGRTKINRVVVYGDSRIDLFRKIVCCDPALYAARVARQTCMHIAKELYFLYRDPARRNQHTGI